MGASSVPATTAEPFSAVKFLQKVYDDKAATSAILEREMSALAEEIAFLKRHPGYESLLLRIAVKITPALEKVNSQA